MVNRWKNGIRDLKLKQNDKMSPKLSSYSMYMSGFKTEFYYKLKNYFGLLTANRFFSFVWLINDNAEIGSVIVSWSNLIYET